MTEATALTIRLHAADNVVVARGDILPGTRVPGERRQHDLLHHRARFARLRLNPERS